jgi:hypothetical protein
LAILAAWANLGCSSGFGCSAVLDALAAWAVLAAWEIVDEKPDSFIHWNQVETWIDLHISKEKIRGLHYKKITAVTDSVS